MKCVFYSYKGGAGRTAALANVAQQLRKMGKSVIVIDFDFDAPGVMLFDKFQPPHVVEVDKDTKYITNFKNGEFPTDLRKPLEESMHKRLGKENFHLSENLSITPASRWTIDKDEMLWKIEDKEHEERFYAIAKGKKLVIDHDRRGILELLSAMLNEQPVNLKDYIYEVEKEGKFDGSLHIMGVSRYEELGELRSKIENYKTSIMVGKFIPTMVDTINANYSPEYILIDSRPGRGYVTVFETQGMKLDTGDLIIVCTNYNKSVIEATYDAAKHIDEYLEEKKIEVPFHPVLIHKPSEDIKEISNEHKEYIKLVENRMQEELSTSERPFKMPPATLGTAGVVTIPIERPMWFDYIIAEEPDPNYEDYVKLTERVISFNPDDIISKIEHAKKKISELIENFNSLKSDPRYENEYQLYFEFGKVLFEKRNLYKESVEELETAYNLTKDRGGHPDIALYLGRVYYHLYLSDKRTEYIDESIKWFGKAEERQRRPSYKLYYEWSGALIKRSGTSEKREDKSELLKKAKDKIERAIEIEPSWESYETKGVILTEESALAETKKEKIEVLKQANDALRESKIWGGGFDTHYTWARNLYNMATLTTDPERRTDALKRCDNLFESAMKFKEKNAEVYYWWGLSLALSASGKRGELRRILLVKASEKLSTAASIRQDYKKAHFYLGAVLFMIEKEADEDQKPLYFRDAFYGMEWTVSLDEPDLFEFYFESTQIQEFEKDTYVFVRTLEDRYGYEPLFEEWVGKQDISEGYIKILNEAIEKYRSGIVAEVN